MLYLQTLGSVYLSQGTAQPMGARPHNAVCLRCSRSFRQPATRESPAIASSRLSGPTPIRSGRATRSRKRSIKRDRNEEIARAVRSRRPKGVILTTLPAGFAQSEDSTTRMIGRMTRILDYATRR